MMRWTVLLLLFICYSIGVFFISDWTILFVLGGFHLFLMLVLRISLWYMCKGFLLMAPFILVTGAMNLLFADLDVTLLIGYRLLLVSNMTMIFGYHVKVLQLATGIRGLLWPLKIFGLNTRDIGVTVAVGVTFIPIIFDEYKRLRETIRSRGARPRIGLTMKLFSYKILYRASILSNTLEAKGYR